MFYVSYVNFLLGRAPTLADLALSHSSYIIFEIPANLFTKWLGPGKSIPLYTITFGLLSVAFAFVRNKSAAYAVRFLLGLAEAGMSDQTIESFVADRSLAGMLPGISYYLSRWYTKDELAFRIAMYIGMS